MPKKPKPENAIPEGSGIIDGNRVYTINAFCRELGFRRNSSLHQRLIRAGLPVIAGRYIRGRDLIDVLGRVMEEEQREAAGGKQKGTEAREAVRQDLDEIS